jgi:hypothetical protein
MDRPMCALSGPSQLMREKEIAIPAFREHLYGIEIVTSRSRDRARKRSLKRRLR